LKKTSSNLVSPIINNLHKGSLGERPLRVDFDVCSSTRVCAQHPFDDFPRRNWDKKAQTRWNTSGRIDTMEAKMDALMKMIKDSENPYCA
jgi:hypothetical protein